LSNPTTQKKPVRPTNPRDKIAFAIATGAGAGLLPVAPGTFGAAEGVLLYLSALSLSRTLSSTLALQLMLLIALSCVVLVVAVWSANSTCRFLSLKDPGAIVIDEVIGQMIALIPLVYAQSIKGMLIGFMLFRLFDIFKPFPIRRLEGFAGGVGVVADDLLAGIYAAAVLSVAIGLDVI
jgi:phosphatidylglycerophosphatase A